MSDDSHKIAATQIAMLPWMTPKRLRTLLSIGDPHEIRLILSRWSSQHSAPMVDIPAHIHALLTTRCSQKVTRLLGDVWCEALNNSVNLPESLTTMDLSVFGSANYPCQLMDDQNAPPLLYSRGDLDLLHRRRVGIVGTRNATEHGRSTAFTFAKVLSRHGVAVVSGLARGIDAAAHRGVSAAVKESTDNAGPIAVVATGLDVVYPREHIGLWNEVGESGLLLSENPPGTGPLPFRFPLRNRIIAGLSEVLLVVESRLDGGSLITVREAAGKMISTSDNLLPVGADSGVLELIQSDPLTLNDISRLADEKLAMSFGDVALSLGRLEAQGWLMCTAGWFERIGAR